MKVTDSSTKNGLRILTVEMPTLESATVTVWVGTGSRYETDKIAGISHFLEHMAFKGGKVYKTARDVSEAIDSIGGEFNASTSKEWTNFYVRASSKHVEKIFDVLSDMLLAPSLKESDINREKGVICEEINMYEDTPMYKIGDVFENLIFGKTSLGRDIIGSKATVNSLTSSDFVKYRETHYRSNNMLITVSGGVDASEIKKLAEKYFGSVDGNDKQEIEIFNFKNSKPEVLVKYKKTDQAHLVLGWPGIPASHNDRYVESVLATVLGGGMSSRLFTEVREKRGLAYSVHADGEHYIDTGYFGAGAGLDPSRIEEAIKVILSEFYKIKNKDKISKKEFDKAKEYMCGHIALSLESTKAINSFLGKEAILTGKIRTVEELFEGIDRVTIEDLYRFADEYFEPKNLKLAIIGPFKEKERFEKIVS